MAIKLRLKRLEKGYKQLSGDGMIGVFEDLENPENGYIIIPMDATIPRMTITEYYERYGEIDTSKVCGWILEFKGWEEDIEDLNKQYREWMAKDGKKS